jgi:DnaJ-class molecular chaperone
MLDPNEDVNGGDCQDCGGTGATYEKDEETGDYEVTGDCSTCGGTGDES